MKGRKERKKGRKGGGRRKKRKGTSKVKGMKEEVQMEGKEA